MDNTTFRLNAANFSYWRKKQYCLVGAKQFNEKERKESEEQRNITIHFFQNHFSFKYAMKKG